LLTGSLSAAMKLLYVTSLTLAFIIWGIDLFLFYWFVNAGKRRFVLFTIHGAHTCLCLAVVVISSVLLHLPRNLKLEASRSALLLSAIALVPLREVRERS
jgi:ABC-type spermidine/putrescine transport system permease subunit II